MDAKEVQFENKYVADLPMISEYVRKVLCRNTVLISIVLALAAAALAAFTLGRQQTIYAMLFAVCALLLLVFGSLLIPVTIKKFMKNAENLRTRKQKFVLRFYEYYFDAHDGNFSMNFDYRKVYRVYELEYSYVLMFTKGNGVMLKKDAFTIGDLDGFKQFIAGHCKRAILPK